MPLSQDGVPNGVKYDSSQNLKRYRSFKYPQGTEEEVASGPRPLPHRGSDHPAAQGPQEGPQETFQEEGGEGGGRGRGLCCGDNCPPFIREPRSRCW